MARLVSIISIIDLFSYFDSGFNVASSNNNINQIPVAIDHLNVHPKQIVISFINPHVTIQLSASTMKIPIIIPRIFKKGSFIYLPSFYYILYKPTCFIFFKNNFISYPVRPTPTFPIFSLSIKSLS